jgi:hypothetical protein
MVTGDKHHTESTLRRGAGWAATGLALLGMFAGLALVEIPRAEARGMAHQPRAHTARKLRASDTAHLHYISASGSILYEGGTASGTIPGSMRVHFNVGATFTGSFTIYTHGGTIKGHGSATPHGSGIYESFAGSLVATGGTGRYAHAHGRAGLYGTFNRNNYALLVQTTGTLLY